MEEMSVRMSSAGCRPMESRNRVAAVSKVMWEYFFRGEVTESYKACRKSKKKKIPQEYGFPSFALEIIQGCETKSMVAKNAIHFFSQVFSKREKKSGAAAVLKMAGNNRMENEDAERKKRVNLVKK